MPSKFEYFINIPLGQIKSEPGSDDANKNELIAFLKKEGLIKQYAAKDGAVQAEGIPETFEEMFSYYYDLACKDSKAMSVLFIDIDFFKNYNDYYLFHFYCCFKSMFFE